MATPAALAHDTTGDPGIHLALEEAITDGGVVVTRLADLGGGHGYSQPGRTTVLKSLTPAESAGGLAGARASVVEEQQHTVITTALLVVRSGAAKSASISGLSRYHRPSRSQRLNSTARTSPHQGINSA
jgi:hypothetical protein